MTEEIYPSKERKFLEGFLGDLTPENIEKWTSEENLSRKIVRNVDGFAVISSIDGSDNPEREREVSLVRAFKDAKYPVHIHEHADGLFYVTKGRGILLPENLPVKPGDIVEIPKGSPHGFEIIEEEPLEFISVQVPPIRDPHTGIEDLKYPEDTRATNIF